MADADHEAASVLRARFGGWKLDLINALNSDPDLKPSDVCVALALVKHLNIGSFTAYPSQGTLAEITHMTVRNVIKCLERLRAAGWLRWARGNMHKSNEYRFDEHKVGREIARMKQDDKDRAARARTRRKPRSDMNQSSGLNEIATRTTVHVPTRTTVHTNTYKEQGCPEDDPTQEDAA